jgi:VanZ family protein
MVTVPVKIRIVLFIATALTILVLSLVPDTPDLIQEVLSWDKSQHALAYAVLTIMGGWALTPLKGGNHGWLMALGIAIIYGMSVEGAQAIGGQRTAQLADAFANTLGAAAVYLARAVACLIRGAAHARK